MMMMMFGMDGCLFLVVVLLCAGGASEESAAVKITASTGDTVILPCTMPATENLPTIEWSKKVDPEEADVYAFVYRNNCEDPYMKNQAFWYRTQLFTNKLTEGNISLRMSDVQPSDTGRYICKTIQVGGKQRTTKFVDLVVAAAVPLTLQCEAACFSPAPVVTFLDDRGNDIGGENTDTTWEDCNTL